MQYSAFIFLFVTTFLYSHSFCHDAYKELKGAMYAKDISLLEQRLAEDKTLVNGKDTDNSTLLMLASSLNFISAVDLLIQKKAALDLVDNSGRTAVMYAIKDDAVRSLRSLLQAKADVNIPDAFNHTVLHYALHKDKKNNEELQLLFGAHPDLHKSNDGGESPYIMITRTMPSDEAAPIIALMRSHL